MALEGGEGRKQDRGKSGKKRAVLQRECGEGWRKREEEKCQMDGRKKMEREDVSDKRK